MDDLSAQPMRLSLQLVLVFIIGSGFRPIQGVTDNLMPEKTIAS
jgi:hypothetical protein